MANWRLVMITISLVQRGSIGPVCATRARSLFRSKVLGLIKDVQFFIDK